MTAPTNTSIRLCDECGEWTYAPTCLPCRQPAPAETPQPPAPVDAGEPVSPGAFRFTVEPLSSGAALYGWGRLR